jgi:serine/threonine protein kinase/Tol biopolymer transport system component
MNANRWVQIEQLYHSALELPPPERDRYLTQVCGDDAELRAEVESLLGHASEGDGLLNRPDWNLSLRLADDVPTVAMKDLSPGSMLGVYRITNKIGVGGMGVVYTATDSKLGRSVALKLVRPEVLDSGSAARFEREARLLASLNHAHIGAIYGFEEQNGLRYLVLEYVPGESLAERLTRGRLPLREALVIARQIAEALEAAHERRVVHRDLKPANIKIGEHDDTKVLDFGLAKAVHRERTGPAGETQTLATPLTRDLMILGTPAYMSPEQACGNPADTRTDVWAFGCVLYECLTGKPAFAGRTVTETLAAVMEREPALSALPADTPEKIASLIRRCLIKDPRNRLRDMRDARITIDEVLSRPATADDPRRRRALSAMQVGAVALIAAIAGSLVTFMLRGRTQVPAVQEVVAFSLSPPEGTAIGLSPARPSPDGKRIAFVAQDNNGKTFIWVRQLGSLAAQKVAGTEGGAGPFWSADGRYIGFTTGMKLMKIDAAGGSPQSICDARGDLGATWGASGDILFTPANRAPLYRVSSAGGTPQQATTLDNNKQENSHRFPHFLPDGRHFLFTARSTRKEDTAIYAGSIDSKETKRLFTAQSQAEFAQPGYIVFAREGSVLAQRFDPLSLQLSGNPRAVADHVDHVTESAAAGFATSANGSLMTHVESMLRRSRLQWFDRHGAMLGNAGDAADYAGVRVAPDGKRLAVVITDPNNGNRDVWLMDAVTNETSRFTSNPANDWYPAWSHDGAYISFASDRDPKSTIYQKPVNGSGGEELLVTSPERGGAFAPEYSPNGRALLFQVDGAHMMDVDIWVLPLSGDRRPYPWANSKFLEFDPKFSPDGKWVAYVSNATGANEIYVRRFDQTNSSRVSLTGGANPVWRRDGRELLFVTPGGAIMSVPVVSGDTFRSATPVKLFQTCSMAPTRGVGSVFDLSPDGNRIIVNCIAPDAKQRPINVLVHWSTLLTRSPKP